MWRLLPRSVAEGGGVSGHESLHAIGNRLSKLSRMQAARATVSVDREARLRIACTSGTDGVRREAAGGIRFERWNAGPGIHGNDH